LPNG
jgi:hypothetical protein